MGQWVVTVAGIAILSVLCDVILPDGQTRKYVKTVFGVMVTLVIIQPLIGLFDGNFSFSTSIGQDIAVQEQYIENVTNRQNQYAINSMKKVLEANDISVENIEVSNVSKTLTIKLSVNHTAKAESKVKEVASTYFSNYKLVVIWT